MSEQPPDLDAALAQLEADYLADLGLHDEAAMVRKQIFAAGLAPAEMSRDYLRSVLGGYDIGAARPVVPGGAEPRAAERAPEEEIQDLRAFAKRYRRALRDHLTSLDRLAPDDETHRLIAEFLKALDDPDGP